MQFKSIIENSTFFTFFIPGMGFPGGSDGKDSAFSAGDPDSISWLRRFPGEGICPLYPWNSPWDSPGKPQYSFLENSMDRGAWQAIVHGVRKNQTHIK